MLQNKIVSTKNVGRLAGKTALISGGAAGIGAAAVRLFASEGARVGVIDIQAEAGKALCAEIEAGGGKAVFAPADVSQSDQVETAIENIVTELGPIDTLFNHAGSIIVKPLHETTESDYDRLMDINVRSAFLVCRKVIPMMLENGGGSIVITSSIGGEKGFALESLYCMTKGAVLQLARSIAVEYRDQGIRCNAVCPAFVKTAHGLREIDELDDQGQKWNETDLHAVQGRICEPEEVAAAALYLASDDASFVNGCALYVDNGWYAKG